MSKRRFNQIALKKGVTAFNTSAPQGAQPRTIRTGTHCPPATNANPFSCHHIQRNAPPNGRALSAFSVDSTSWFCGHILSEAVHGPIYSRTTCVDLDSNCLPPQYTIFIGPHAILQTCGLHFSFSSLIGYLWTRNHAL